MESNELTEKEMAEVKAIQDLESGANNGRILRLSLIVSVLVSIFHFQLLSQRLQMLLVNKDVAWAVAMIRVLFLTQMLTVFTGTMAFCHFLFQRRITQLHAIIRKLDANQAVPTLKQCDSGEK